MSVLVVRRSLLRERPLAMRALIGAYRRSIERVRATPAEAGALVQKHEMGLTAAVATAAIPRSNLVFIDAQTARPQIEGLLRLFLEAAPASIGGALPNDGFYAPPTTP
jgi:NitT/TauT family transport system substrate-binding protein